MELQRIQCGCNSVENGEGNRDWGHRSNNGPYIVGLEGHWLLPWMRWDVTKEIWAQMGHYLLKILKVHSCFCTRNGFLEIEGNKRNNLGEKSKLGSYWCIPSKK